MNQVINNVEINTILKNDIKRLSENNPGFTVNDLLKVLEKYLLPTQIMKLLDVGRTSYYAFKRNPSHKFMTRKLYDFYLSLEF